MLSHKIKRQSAKWHFNKKFRRLEPFLLLEAKSMLRIVNTLSLKHLCLTSFLIWINLLDSWTPLKWEFR